MFFLIGNSDEEDYKYILKFKENKNQSWNNSNSKIIIKYSNINEKTIQMIVKKYNGIVLKRITTIIDDDNNIYKTGEIIKYCFNELSNIEKCIEELNSILILNQLMGD